MSNLLTENKAYYSGKIPVKNTGTYELKKYVLNTKEISEDMSMDEIADVTSDRLIKVFTNDKSSTDDKKATVE